MQPWKRQAGSGSDGRLRARGSKFWCYSGADTGRGVPPMTYGRSIEHALEAFHIDRREWGPTSLRTVWRGARRCDSATRQAGSQRH